MNGFGETIRRTVESLHIKSLIKRKGITKQEAAQKVIEFLTCGEKISLHDFMEREIL